MDDLVSGFFGSSTPNWLSTSSHPALDVIESPKAFTVKLDAPGMDAKDINVQVHGGVLTMSGHRQEEKTSSDKTFHRLERRSGSFSRTVTLPCSINEDEVAAEYSNGVLTLTLPKSEAAMVKKIAVKG
jgi:HSP20 family protein